MNGYNESKETVEKFVKEKGLQQKVLLQGRDVAREKYAVDGYPTSFLIDRAGKVVHREVGFSPTDAPAHEARIREILSASPPTKP